MLSYGSSYLVIARVIPLPNSCLKTEVDFGESSFHLRVRRYFQVDSTLDIHLTRLVGFGLLHQQNLTLLKLI